MRIHNIYADENGETHFRDVEIELSEAGPDGTTSKRFPATGFIFRTTPADWFFDWHPASPPTICHQSGCAAPRHRERW